MNPVLAIKEARTAHDVHPLVRQRFSPRAFSHDPISETELLTLIEAAAWAPSSMNGQPWRFRYALRGDAAFERLVASMSPGNSAWTVNAAAVVAVSAKAVHANGQPNTSWQFDTGLAVGNLLLQATAIGVHGHLIGGFDHAGVSALLQLESEAESVICLLVLGRLGSAETLQEPFLSRELSPRNRKPLTEIAVRIEQ